MKIHTLAAPRDLIRDVGLLLLTICVVTVVVGSLARYYADEVGNARARVSQIYRTIEAAQELGIAVRDAERGQRGFLLTGSDDYLAPYVAAKDRIARAEDNLARLTAGDSAEQAQLRTIATEVEAKLGVLAQAVALHRGNKPDAALAIVKSDVGRQLMIQIEGGLVGLREIAAERLANSERDSVQADTRLVWFAFAGSGLVAAMSGVCVWYAIRMRRAQNQMFERTATLDTVLDALPVGVIIADANGGIVRDNAANRQLWGVTPETLNWEGYADWIGFWPETGKQIKADEWAMARALLRGTWSATNW